MGSRMVPSRLDGYFNLAMRREVEGGAFAPVSLSRLVKVSDFEWFASY